MSADDHWPASSLYVTVRVIYMLSYLGFLHYCTARYILTLPNHALPIAYYYVQYYLPLIDLSLQVLSTRSTR